MFQSRKQPIVVEQSSEKLNSIQYQQKEMTRKFAFFQQTINVKFSSLTDSFEYRPLKVHLEEIC